METSIPINGIFTKSGVSELWSYAHGIAVFRLVHPLMLFSRSQVSVNYALLHMESDDPLPLRPTCKRSSWSCDFFCRMLSNLFLFSVSSLSHSCLELVGRPIHLISFFSLEMMFIAMRTLRASYTRRLMFFWSYWCCTIRESNTVKKNVSSIIPL